MIFSPSDHGFTYSDQEINVFFGKANFSSSLKAYENSLILGRQTHGAELIDVSIHQTRGSSQFLSSSDGLCTNQKEQKLTILTADCVPCFIFSPQKLYSLHLGWRSLALGLLDKALSEVHKNDPIKIFIGPHIGPLSFEVQQDVISAFSKNTSSQTWYKKISAEKYLVDLNQIIKIKAEGFNARLMILDEDTKTNLDFYSYRREPQNCGRNISFAFLKKTLFN